MSNILYPAHHRSSLSSYDSFDKTYRALMANVIDDISTGRVASIPNARTGEVCHTYAGAIAFNVPLQLGMPFSTFRKFFYGSAAAEAAWFAAGTQDATWINEKCPLWQKWCEDDGVTVKNAYGHRMRNHFGRDQLAEVVAGLVADPSSRQMVVSMWDPTKDGLANAGKEKNVPCPYSMVFDIVGDELTVCYTIRSSDMFVGLPYDVYTTALLVDSIVHQIRSLARTEGRTSLQFLKPGNMGVILANPHVYDSHVPLLIECNNSWKKASTTLPRGHDLSLPLPGWTLNELVQYPDNYYLVGRWYNKQIDNYLGPDNPMLNVKPDVAV